MRARVRMQGLRRKTKFAHEFLACKLCERRKADRVTEVQVLEFGNLLKLRMEYMNGLERGVIR